MSYFLRAHLASFLLLTPVSRLRVGPASASKLFPGLLLWALLLFPIAAFAQGVQYTASNPDQSSKSDLHVDPSTLSMNLQITLGSYPGRAGLNVPVTISYSSKLWRMEYEDSWLERGGGCHSDVMARYAEHSASGWTSSLGNPSIELTGLNEAYNSQGQAIGDGGCNPNSPPTYSTLYINRINVRLPDGSTHELRQSDSPVSTFSSTGNFYAVDGSRLRYDGSTSTLYLPDGSRYVFGATQNGALIANVFYDRNGNMLSTDGTHRRWYDTLGRILPDPLPPVNEDGSGPPAWGNTTYFLPGVNNTQITYTLRWRYLSEVLTPDPVTGQVPALRYAGDNIGMGGGYAPVSPALFSSLDSTTVVTSNNLFNPVVLAGIDLPTGQSYNFTYNEYGEITKAMLPTGGYERYNYAQIPPTSYQGYVYREANRGVVDRWVSTDGTYADEAAHHWSYSVGSAGSPAAYAVSMTGPDGTRTERLLYSGGNGRSIKFGFDDPLIGMAFEERVFSSNQMLRRKLTDWAVSTNTYPWGYTSISAKRNPRMTKEVEILLDTGGDALANTTTYDYDTTYQFDVGLDQTRVWQYDYASVAQTTAQNDASSSIPLGSLIRSTQTSYMTGNASYRSLNLLGLPSSVSILNPYDSTVAETDYVYDEAGYLLSDYASVTNWTDPGTSIRGNVTTLRKWLNTTNTRLDTHTQYDQCGSVRSIWDALNHQSQVSYSSLNAYAYPTQTTSAVPDATGHASNSSLTTSSSYDFNTGLPLSQTDANNKTTLLHYTDPQSAAVDPLNRLRWVELPTTGCGAGGASSCGTTTYIYGDTTGNLYVETLSSLDATRNLDSFQYFDKVGRPSRTLLNEAGSWLLTDKQYDVMGRLWRVSNPYRSTQGNSSPVNPSGNWTTTAYDALGRIQTVTTPDTAFITTSYSGNSVTVTDPHDAGVAGHSRKSVTDALGRLIQVIEDPSGLTYQTSYLYDALGNLRMVTQGSQTRYFMYDSLSRLIRAKNPEQSANPALALSDGVTGNSAWSTSYDYDANGNLQARIDARGVRTDYTYDALNRNLTVRYQNDPVGTPGVDRYYDGATLGKGRAWKTITAGAANSYTVNESYDAMGRPLSMRQQFFYNNAWSQSYTVQRSYDLAGHVISQTYPSGRTVSYTYDAAGRAQSFTGNLGDGVQRSYSTNISYNEWGLQQEQFGTQIPVFNKHFYNVRGQLAEIRESTTANDTSWNRGALINHYSGHCWGMCSLDSTSATDDNGNLKKQDHWIPRDDAVTGYDVYTDFYEYDSLNRLQSARETLNGGPINWQQSYVYDQWGNRTIDQASANTFGTGIPHPQFTVNTATNQLTVPAGQSGVMSYDAAGNLTNDTYTSYGVRTFDAENRMVTAQDSFGGTSSYIYDADGRRVRRTSNNTQVWQVYGMDGELLAEYAAGALPSSTPQKEYGYRNGELLITAAPSSNGQSINLSQGKTATESSNLYGTASLAVDGNTSGNFSNNSVTHTNYEANAWWQVDLGSIQSIQNIQLYNRTDCCSDRLSNFYLFVSDQPFTSTDLQTTINQAGVWYSYTQGAVGVSSTIAVNRTGRYVRVQLAGTNVLSLAEVQVMGQAAGGTGTDLEWLVIDQLGTPRMMLDLTGSLSGTKRHDYLPFGEELFAGTGGRTSQQGYAADAIRQKFTQKERDNETGLDYFGARYYSSPQGRFSSPDPLLSSGKLLQPQSWNRYTYCVNGPLKYVDPKGLIWGTQDFYQDGHRYRRYRWFNGDKVGKGFTPFIPAKGGTVIALADGGGARIYRNGSSETWSGPAGGHTTGQDTFNLAVGHAHGMASAAMAGSPGKPVVDWVFNQIGGVDKDSQAYSNGKVIGDGVVGSGIALITGGVGAPGAEGPAEEGATMLYRVVKQPELEDILATNTYRIGGGFATEGKYFFETAEDAVDFGRKMFSIKPAEGAYTLTSTEVDRAVIQASTPIKAAGEGPALFVPKDQLPLGPVKIWP